MAEEEYLRYSRVDPEIRALVRDGKCGKCAHTFKEGEHRHATRYYMLVCCNCSEKVPNTNKRNPVRELLG